MDDFWGSQAERLKLIEMQSKLRKAMQGDNPGIRTRSYHRALKSKKEWAITLKTCRDLNSRLCNIMFDAVLRENPFVKISGLQAWLPNITEDESRE